MEVIQNGSYILYQFQIVQRGFEGASHQKFHRKIVYALAADGMGLVHEVLPHVLEPLHHHSRQGLINLLIRSLIRRYTAFQLQSVDELLFQFFFLRELFFLHNSLRSSVHLNFIPTLCGNLLHSGSGTCTVDTTDSIRDFPVM